MYLGCENMNNLMAVIKSTLKGKIGAGYNNSYLSLMCSYEEAMRCLQNSDNRTFDIFCDWLATEGMGIFNTIADTIQNKNLDSRFGVFMEIYKSYLEDAISEECMQSALDFLYLIPEKMKDDFSKFGFLQNEKQEYMWEYVESAKSNGEYQYFWKPDSYCQVLLAC